jgi:tetraacyldisaccharide 4'-kinase
VNLKCSLLWPLSFPYGAIAHLRARLYRQGVFKQRRLDARVISVGNLTVGGTGKTPMVMWIADRLLNEGKSVGILTRGYGGERVASVSNAGERDNAATEIRSDEVRMLKDRLGGSVSLGVGADRFEQGQRLAKVGVKWFVLDDGFQHLRLARDVDIVLIDATDPFGGGHSLPAGRLREPRTALRRADVIVITRSNHAPAVEAAIRRDSDAPIFYARTEFDSIRGVWSERLNEDSARQRKLFAFCGIGNPSQFIADLRDWGFQVAGHQFFPDHHRYSQRDADEIEQAARAAGASSVICTEKDLSKLSKIHWRTCDLFVCRISLRIEREDDFWRAVMTKAEARSDAKR